MRRVCGVQLATRTVDICVLSVDFICVFFAALAVFIPLYLGGPWHECHDSCARANDGKCDDSKSDMFNGISACSEGSDCSDCGPSRLSRNPHSTVSTYTYLYGLTCVEMHDLPAHRVCYATPAEPLWMPCLWTLLALGTSLLRAARALRTIACAAVVGTGQFATGTMQLCFFIAAMATAAGSKPQGSMEGAGWFCLLLGSMFALVSYANPVWDDVRIGASAGVLALSPVVAQAEGALVIIAPKNNRGAQGGAFSCANPLHGGDGGGGQGINLDGTGADAVVAPQQQASASVSPAAGGGSHTAGDAALHGGVPRLQQGKHLWLRLRLLMTVLAKQAMATAVKATPMTRAPMLWRRAGRRQ